MTTSTLDQGRTSRARGASPTETDRTAPTRDGRDRRTTSTGRTQAGPERTGEQRTGEQRTGDQRTGDQRTGDQRTGQQRAGRDGTGRERVGQKRSGQRQPGQKQRGQGRGSPARDDARAGGTAPFVLLIMVLLTSGLVATLWLSTAAAADSYRLDAERQHARDLSEQTERLHRDVESARSAPAIAAAAQRDGMVPAGEPAVLLVAPDGSTRVIGSPRAARSAPVSPPPAASPSPLAVRPPTPGVPPTQPSPPTQPIPRAVADPEVLAQTGADQVGTPTATDATGTAR